MNGVLEDDALAARVYASSAVLQLPVDPQAALDACVSAQRKCFVATLRQPAQGARGSVWVRCAHLVSPAIAMNPNPLPVRAKRQPPQQHASGDEVGGFSASSGSRC